MVTFTTEPNAVLDTNVGLAIYSWHDILRAAEPILKQDPTANLTHAEIQFRAQRARTAFILTLFFNERGWATLVPLNELLRTLMDRAPPEGAEHGLKSNFVKFFLYFVNDKLLPAWRNGADPYSDANIAGNDVDRLCLDWAAERSIPLISWEGHGPRGPLPKKLIPREARKRGIDLVTPEELLKRETFDETEAVRRFFADWARHAPGYVSNNPGAKNTLEHLHHFYRRMADNDWTP